jgi:biopolymer transport protein ExbD
MTPFVSVALLLITFFVWLKMLQRPNVLEVRDIDRKGKYEIDHYPRHVCLLYLLDKNQISFLHYQHESELAEIVATNYGASGLPRLLKETLKQAGSKEELVVFIKAANQANLRNIVDAIDELKIAGNLLYIIGYPLSANEKRMLADYDRFRETDQKRPIYVSARLTDLPIY